MTVPKVWSCFTDFFHNFNAFNNSRHFSNMTAPEIRSRFLRAFYADIFRKSFVETPSKRANSKVPNIQTFTIIWDASASESSESDVLETSPGTKKRTLHQVATGFFPIYNNSSSNMLKPDHEPQ